VTVSSPDRSGVSRRRGPVWAAGLVVALGAGVATAHGLYGVATAARVPAAIAWLYPLITDGLALVAYAATARLSDRGCGYAWTVVVLAAGLSGTAQASYLAGGVTGEPPAALRFGVGAWPAVAAAIVAHLLHLLGTATAHGTALTATGQPAGPTAPTPAVTPANHTPPEAPVPPAVPVPSSPLGGTPSTGTPDPAQPVRDTALRPGTAGGRRTPKYSDAEILAKLDGRPAAVSVNAAVREFECGPDRARRLLAQAGLLAPRDPASQGAAVRPQPPSGRPVQPLLPDDPASQGATASQEPPSGRPVQPMLPESYDQPEIEHADRRALHLVHGNPDPRTEQ